MNKNIQKSFTLIEILVIMTIISLLSISLYKGAIIFQGLGSLTSAKSSAAVIKNSLAENIIGDWPFSEGSGTSISDLSRYHNTGTIHGATWVANPKSNCISDNCLSFNRSNEDCVYINNVAVPITGTTISIWVKPATMTIDSKLILSPNMTVAISPSGIIWTYVSTVAEGWHFGGETSIGYSWINKWHLVTVTYSAATNTMKYFRDGVQVYSDSTSSTGNLSQIIDTVYIGTENDEYFNGSIDDVRIYDAAISTSQIKEQYYSGLNQLLAKREISKEDFSDRYGSGDI